MQSVTVRQPCAAPAEVVWTLATDLAALPETMSGIAAVEPERSYTAEATSRGMHYVTTFQFLPTEHGTDVVMTFGGEALGTAAKVMSRATGWAMTGSVRKLVQKDLADLATAAEART